MPSTGHCRTVHTDNHCPCRAFPRSGSEDCQNVSRGMACDQGSKSEDDNGKGICRALSCGCHSYIAGGHRFTSLSFGVGGERSCRFSRPSRLALADEVKVKRREFHHATRRRGGVATCRTCAADQEIHHRLFQPSTPSLCPGRSPRSCRRPSCGRACARWQARRPAPLKRCAVEAST
jgi:hypothetical protein